MLITHASSRYETLVPECVRSRPHMPRPAQSSSNLKFSSCAAPATRSEKLFAKAPVSFATLCLECVDEQREILKSSSEKLLVLPTSLLAAEHSDEIRESEISSTERHVRVRPRCTACVPDSAIASVWKTKAKLVAGKLGSPGFAGPNFRCYQVKTATELICVVAVRGLREEEVGIPTACVLVSPSTSSSLLFGAGEK